MSLVRARELAVEYASAGYVVRPIDGLDLDIGDGHLALLLGPSGCGKTSVLSCLAGILRPAAGSIVVAGVDVTRLDAPAASRYRRERVGVVFQSFNLLASLDALANVALPLRLAGWSRARAGARARELLEEVGMTDRAGHRPAQLSGGQQQRVAIARALALEPPVLLADEPTAHLDVFQVESVLSMLRDLARPGRAVVVSTHDHRLVPLADQTIDLAPNQPQVAHVQRERVLAAGEVLFREGDPSDVVYTVRSGQLEVYRTRVDGSEQVVARTPPGAYVGELGPLLGLPRSASVRAVEPTVVLAQDITSFREHGAAGPADSSSP